MIFPFSTWITHIYKYTHINKPNIFTHIMCARRTLGEDEELRTWDLERDRESVVEVDGGPRFSTFATIPTLLCFVFRWVNNSGNVLVHYENVHRCATWQANEWIVNAWMPSLYIYVYIYMTSYVCMYASSRWNGWMCDCGYKAIRIIPRYAIVWVSARAFLFESTPKLDYNNTLFIIEPRVRQKQWRPADYRDV